MLKTWLPLRARRRAFVGTPTRTTSKATPSGHAFLRLESLEDRCTPATFTVLNTGDVGAGSLRQAVIDSAAGDTIQFSAALAGQTINLQSEIALNKAVTVQGLGQGQTILSGRNANRVFNVTGAATVSGLTLTLGNSAADGGAVLVNNVAFTLTDAAVTNSSATGQGGGLAVTGASGVLELTRALVSGNVAASDGGGVSVAATATSTIASSVITGNQITAAFDGAGVNNDGTLTVTDTTFSNNLGLTTAAFGGALENEGTATVSRSLFLGNVAGRGGAISATSGTLTVQNSTFSGNSTTVGSDGGGAVVVVAGTTSLLNVTITSNTDASGAATAAGGLSITGGTVNLNNSVLADNIASAGTSNDIRGNVSGTSGNNAVTSNANSNIPAGDVFTSAQIALAPLADNGGPTPTRAPLATSVLIDTGSNAAATTLTTDGRGFRRVVNGGTSLTVDKGAVEYQPPGTTTTLTVTPGANLTAGAAVQLQVVVVGAAASSNTPAGTVTFLLNGNPFDAAPLGAGGTATLVTDALPVGTYTLSARYGGDPQVAFSPSTSATASVTVAASAAATPTALTLTSSANAAVTAANVTFTAKVTATTGTATPAGTVTFAANGLLLGTSTLDATGTATITSNTLPLGLNLIEATYNGNATFQPTSLAQPFRQFVQPTNPLPTTTTLTASTATPTLSQAVTYTALVAPAAPNLAPVDGIVTFKAGTTVLGTANVTGGVAVFTTTRTPVGTSAVTATYSGDGTFAGSVSTATNVAVKARSTIGQFDPTSGNWFLRNANSAGNFDFSFVYGLANWKPVPGDWNSDGVVTPGIVDPSTMTWYLRNSNSSGLADAATPFVFGAVGSAPVSGKWTAAATSFGVGVAAPTSGGQLQWQLKNVPGAGTADFSFVFGMSTWTPLVGDWDGDGVYGIGAFDPSTATWYIRNSLSAGAADLTFQYGVAGWKPVVGDWDGNGTWTNAVVAPDASGNGLWYIRNTLGAGVADITPFLYGLSFWSPISGPWGPTPVVSQPASAPGETRPAAAQPVQPAQVRGITADDLASGLGTSVQDHLFSSGLSGLSV